MKYRIKSAHTANTCFILHVLSTWLLVLLYAEPLQKVNGHMHFHKRSAECGSARLHDTWEAAEET